MNEKRAFFAACAAYLRWRLPLFIVLAAMLVIFHIVLSLYGFATEAVRYAALLSGALGLAACVVDFALFYRKHRRLSQLQNSILLSLEDLPAPSSLHEADYQALIKLLHEENRAASHRNSRSLAEMTQYYTIWVHQIKTPIAAMELMLQSGNYDEAALRTELFRIEEYVEMVLYYLRLESSSTDYLLQSYDLDQIVRQSLRKYARMFIQKGIKLVFRDVKKTVLSDEKWLSFVIEQILSNAIKYTQNGSVAIYLEDGQLVIEDTGVGVAESDLPRIFSRGFTGYNGREDKHATGLGLSLCKDILEKLSHTISITSQLGVGTKVTIGFPPPSGLSE